MTTAKVLGARMAQIDFFYDVASPYSWLAFETLLRYRNVWQAEVNLRPFFLGGVMDSTKNKPPGTLPAKMKYMVGDLKRMAKYHGVPLQLLKDRSAMGKTLDAQRLLTAASMDSPEDVERLSRELWKRIWGGGGDIATAEGLSAACIDAGLSEESTRTLLDRTHSEDVKQRLHDVTDEALERGAFGAPWITLHKQGVAEETEVAKKWVSFWGCDRFDLLANELGEPYLGPHPPSSSSGSISQL